MAPLVQILQDDARFRSVVCVTAQHRQMLDQVLNLFDIIPDYDLDIMTDKQDLFHITVRGLTGLRKVLMAEKPDMVLVQGDTTTCLTGALSAFYLQIPVGHIEAGLRTFDLKSPFPEEANRSLTAKIADFHFAPTEKEKVNLINENVSEKRIWVTGNTVIDALLFTRKKVKNSDFGEDTFGSATGVIRAGRPFVLITGHRRENMGRNLAHICSAVKQMALKFPGWSFIYPVHLNPRVKSAVHSHLGNSRNIHLIPPLEYSPFVHAMENARFIITDSGGIQEEAPSLGKPVLVTREHTERTQALAAGTIHLVGADSEKIIARSTELINDDENYLQSTSFYNPYGDGDASKRIVEIIAQAPFPKEIRKTT